MARKQDLDWSFGLRASHGKWLTVEAFGNKLVCAAAIMKKKQIFFLEKTEGLEEVAIRTHVGRYLRCDGDGEFLADGEKGDDETKWLIEAQPDGRWALKSLKYGWYAGASGEIIEGNRQCFEKTTSESKLFTVKLAMHPMVTIQNVKRTKYLHLNDAGDSVTTDEVVPWGDDAVLSIEFNATNGTYQLHTSNGMILSSNGALTAEAVPESDFILEFHGGVVSFKSKANGKYLTALGAQGLTKATKATVTKDEQFELQNSYPQINLQSFNKKFVSSRQGIELAATQAAANSDSEIFQLMPLDNDKWNLVASNGDATPPTRIVGMEANGSIHALSTEAGGETEFDVEFYGTSIALKAANGKYVTQLKNSYLKASGEEPTGESLFTFTLVNRPRLVLRGEHGFIQQLPSGLLECNKSSGEEFDLATGPAGVSIGKNGKFWQVGDNGISVAGESEEYYNIELFKNSKMVIKHGEKYFRGYQNGAFTATGAGVERETLFEY
jgi:fascin 1/2